MIETVRFSIGGSRAELESLLRRARLGAQIKDYPARSRMYLEVGAESDERRRLEECLRQLTLDVGRKSFFQASPEEFRTEPLFATYGVRWTDDYHQIVAEPAYSGRDACPHCGKGAQELAQPLRVYVDKLEGADFVRVPPGLFLGSKRLVELIDREDWSGIRTEPILDRRRGEATDVLSQLVTTSVLPPMHPSGTPVRSPTPKFCGFCRKLGYQLPAVQPAYARTVVGAAMDWNQSGEWTAPHFVSCPSLICSQRVVRKLLELEPCQEWIPVKLVD